MTTELPKLDLVLEKGAFQRLGFSCFYEGKRLNSASSLLPYELRTLARKALSYESIEPDLLEFLIESELSFNIYVQLSSGRRLLHWDPTFTLHSKTCFDCQNGNQVSISRIADHNGAAFSQLVLLGESMLVDPASGRLGYLLDTSGWDVWQYFADLDKVCPDMKITSGGAGLIGSWAVPNQAALDQIIEIPLDFFNALSGGAPSGWVTGSSLMVDGQPASVQARTLEPCVILYKTNLSSERLVRIGYQSAGGVLGPHATMVDFLVKQSGLSSTLKLARVRSEVLALCWSLLDVERDALSDYLNALNFSAISEDAQSCLELRTYLEQFFAFIDASRPQYMAFPDGWYVSEVDFRVEARLFFVAWSAFPVDYFSRFSEVGLYVEDVDALRQIATLQKLCDLYSIRFLMDDKPIELLSWDVTLDLRSDGDGFEIRPEISQGQQPILEGFLAEILSQNGKIELADRIQLLDPEVLAVLRVIFAQKAGAPTEVSNSKRDFIRVPRLQILDWLYLRQHGVTLRLSAQDEQMIASLISFEKIESIPLPTHFSGTLRAYQKQAYDWLMFHYVHKFGSVLADDMGLGKTIQTLVFLAGIREEMFTHASIKSSVSPNAVRAFLIVVPPGLVFNWQREIQTFCPEFKVGLCIQQDVEMDFETPDVVLTTYEFLRRHFERFEAIEFDVVVFDEAQLVKNIYAARTAAVRRLKSRFKLGLTGTPLENHVGEFFSIMDLAIPGVLGDYNAFQAMVKSGGESRLLMRSRPFVLRRTKQEILPELPAKVDSIVELGLSDLQKTLYEAVLSEVRQTVKQAYEDKAESRARVIALTAILRLRQLCVTPALLDKTLDVMSPKVICLLDKLKEIQAEGHHAIVFTQFRAFLELLMPVLAQEGIAFIRMDGKTPMAKRRGLVDTFQNSETPLAFFMTLKTGGMGLNLTRASYVFHLDPWWNPVVEEQASDRAHRIGQLQTVFVNRFIMHDTIEEKMMVLKKKKEALFHQVLSHQKAGRGDSVLSRDDILFLLS